MGGGAFRTARIFRDNWVIVRASYEASPKVDRDYANCCWNDMRTQNT